MYQVAKDVNYCKESYDDQELSQISFNLLYLHIFPSDVAWFHRSLDTEVESTFLGEGFLHFLYVFATVVGDECSNDVSMVLILLLRFDLFFIFTNSLKLL